MHRTLIVRVFDCWVHQASQQKTACTQSPLQNYKHTLDHAQDCHIIGTHNNVQVRTRWKDVNAEFSSAMSEHPGLQTWHTLCDDEQHVR
jgi:hypothetical protein